MITVIAQPQCRGSQGAILKLMGMAIFSYKRHFQIKCLDLALYELVFKLQFSNAFLVLELNDLPNLTKDTNLMTTFLVTNEKLPFQFPL